MGTTVSTQDQGLEQGQAAAEGAAIWQIDPAHSLVEFAVKHMMFTTVKGRFPEVTGTITYDEADPARSTVRVEIPVAAITTGQAQRDEHLRSADFFDVEQFPAITFVSTRVEPAGHEHLTVVGDLTIRGVTHQATLDTTFNGRGVNPWGQQVAGWSAVTEINRQDYGLTWNAALEAGGVLVGDKVKISLDIQASRQ